MAIHIPKYGLPQKYFECRRQYTEVPSHIFSVIVNENIAVTLSKMVIFAKENNICT